VRPYGWRRCISALIAGSLLVIAVRVCVATLEHDERISSQYPLGWPVRGGMGLRQTYRITDRSTLIDPVLVYSTYLGGTSIASGTAIGPGGQSINAFPQGITASDVDSTGNIYIAGATSAPDFPVTSGVVQPSNTQNNQVGFLSKLDPTGQTLLFSTYLHGLGSVSSIALDSSGNIYVAGIAPAQNPTPLAIPAGTTPYNAAARDIYHLE
jgi:hypothetical protein